MKNRDIIKFLLSEAKPFKEINVFSDKPGIYALFFCGKTFPFHKYKPKLNEIIYIGKTESSQLSRDANTHFANGKTGSSTLRRTFGAFLLEKLKLKPIPRGQSDIENKRYTHFKFEDNSEVLLTNWMQANLGLSFYPYPKSKNEIDNLETQLIQEIIPILNIDHKNPINSFASQIKELRKKTGEMAYQVNRSPLKNKVSQPQKTHIKMEKIDITFTTDIHKYEDIWNQVSNQILSTIKTNDFTELHLGSSVFNKVGNRKSYSFNLEYTNGIVSNNIGGSAVARDLARVLESKVDFKIITKGKFVKIKMDNEFTLHISSK